MKTRATLVSVLAIALGACAPSLPAAPAAPIAQGSAWRLDFDGPGLFTPSVGAGPVAAVVVGNGTYRVVPSFDGSKALEFPAFGDGAGLALVVRQPDGNLPTPGHQDFSFGADVRSDSFAVSDEDGGANVLQRGLASQVHQFKLQVDDGRPSCVVGGSGGRVVAKAKAVLGRHWYRLRCDREGESITLEVVDLETPSLSPLRVRAKGLIGDVTLPPGVPLSIGRKVGLTGEAVLSEPDQFSGTLDNAWIEVTIS